MGRSNNCWPTSTWNFCWHGLKNNLIRIVSRYQSEWTTLNFKLTRHFLNLWCIIALYNSLLCNYKDWCSVLSTEVLRVTYYINSSTISKEILRWKSSASHLLIYRRMPFGSFWIGIQCVYMHISNHDCTMYIQK